MNTRAGARRETNGTAKRVAVYDGVCATLLRLPLDIGAPSSAWAARITACWRSSVEAILEVGRLLAAAKDALAHGEFGTMIESELPFGARTAQMLMAIAADPRLHNPKHVSHLPPSWGTLYELTKLDDEHFVEAIKQKVIRSDMERREIAQAVKAERRAARERELGERQAALPTKRYGIIVADPEWRFEPRSRETGMDRAADNHYPTSRSEVIAGRDVASIAADDCVLFLWATAPMLPQALIVMAAWGFDYKTHLIWHKLRSGNARGTGYWATNEHELLLIGARGQIPAPATAMCASLIAAPWQGRHSAKPEIFLQIIEREFPTVPKIELNRRGPARVGWSAWGNEAQLASDSDEGPSPSLALAPSPPRTAIQSARDCLRREITTRLISRISCASGIPIAGELAKMPYDRDSDRPAGYGASQYEPGWLGVEIMHHAVDWQLCCSIGDGTVRVRVLGNPARKAGIKNGDYIA